MAASVESGIRIGGLWWSSCPLSESIRQERAVPACHNDEPCLILTEARDKGSDHEYRPPPCLLPILILPLGTASLDPAALDHFIPVWLNPSSSSSSSSSIWIHFYVSVIRFNGNYPVRLAAGAICWGQGEFNTPKTQKTKLIGADELMLIAACHAFISRDWMDSFGCWLDTQRHLWEWAINCHWGVRSAVRWRWRWRWRVGGGEEHLIGGDPSSVSTWRQILVKARRRLGPIFWIKCGVPITINLHTQSYGSPRRWLWPELICILHI